MKAMDWLRRLGKVLCAVLLIISGLVIPPTKSGVAAAPPPPTIYLPILFANSSGAVQTAKPSEPPLPHFTYTHDYYVRRAQTLALNAPSPTNNMTYHGGNVMRQFHAYTIFWDPNNNLQASFRTLLNRYFQDIGGTPFYNIVTQYSDGGGNIQNISDLGGTWLDTANAYPHAGTGADPLTDGDIRAEVNRAISANGWPSGGLTNMYFVFTEQGIESCFNANSCTPGVPNGQPSAYCAYHTFFDSNKIYANMPFVNSWGGCSAFGTAPNGSTANDAEVSTASHEHIEAVTDPQLDAWYDSDLSGEIGDKCNQAYGATTLAGSNMTGHGNPYILQLEWSNARFTASGTSGSGCAADYLPPTVTIVKTAPANGVAGTGLLYGLAVTNNGGPTAETPSLTDALPFGTLFQSIGVPAGWTCTTPAVGTNGTITCGKANGFLANGEAANFTIGVNLRPTIADGTLLNNTGAVAWDTAYRQNPLTASHTRSTLVQARADLVVAKSAALDPVVAGTDESYVLTVTNQGPSDSQNVLLSDATPANTTFVSLIQSAGPTFGCTTPVVGGIGAIDCSRATLATGETAAFTLVVHVNASAPDGSQLFNTVLGSSSTTDPNAANNAATVVSAVIARADLSLVKTQSADVIIADIAQTYHLELTNLGPSDAQAIELTDPIPEHTTFVSLAQTGGPALTCNTPPAGGIGPIHCAGATLAAGDTAGFTVVVLIDPVDVSVITNTATAASITIDPNPANNTVSVSAEDSVYRYKQLVLADLTLWQATLSDHEDRETAAEAVRALAQSLNPVRWLDGNLLVSHSGAQVFEREKETVQKLLELSAEEDDEADDPIDHASIRLTDPLLDFVNRLVMADRALADVALTEAVGHVPTQHLLRGHMEFQRGGAAFAAGAYAHAIEHFQRAWQSAQPDGDDDTEN